MHEFSLVDSLLSQVSRQTLAHPGAQVRSIAVRIGAASGVEVELFQRAFEQLRSGNFLHTELRVESVAARWLCRACQRELATGEALYCDACQLPATLVAGAELMLDRIELEVSHV